MIFGLEQEGGSLIAPMALAHPLHPIDNRSRNKRRNLWVGRCVSSWWPWFPSRSSVLIYIYIYMHSLYEFCYRTYIQRESHSVLAKLHPITIYRIVFLGSARLNATFCFLSFTNCVLLFDKSLILGSLWPLVFVLNNTLILGIWCSTTPHFPGCFYPWTFFENIGFNTVLTHLLIFCRGVSGFATDCPCDVWCRGLTTCLQHVGPPFGNRILNNSWAVGLTLWIINLIFLCFDICNYICLDTSDHF